MIRVEPTGIVHAVNPVRRSDACTLSMTGADRHIRIATGAGFHRARSAKSPRTRPGRYSSAPTRSGVLSSMSEANCFIVLAHEQSDVDAGDTVDIMLFDGLV